jgi:hypothetical protein
MAEPTSPPPEVEPLATAELFPSLEKLARARAGR